jgi:hypothetical protein
MARFSGKIMRLKKLLDDDRMAYMEGDHWINCSNGNTAIGGSTRLLMLQDVGRLTRVKGCQVKC